MTLLVERPPGGNVLELRPGLGTLLAAVDAVLNAPLSDHAEAQRLALAMARERFRQATELRSVGLQVDT